MVDHSVVMAGAVVSEGAVLRDSVVLPGARIEARAHLDHSIVGVDARVGEGAVLSGLTVIGNGVVVQGGAHLDRARLPDN